MKTLHADSFPTAMHQCVRVACVIQKLPRRPVALLHTSSKRFCFQTGSPQNNGEEDAERGCESLSLAV